MRRLDKFPAITIPYPIFDTLSDRLEIPSSESIASLLVKLITISHIKYIDEILNEVSQLGDPDSFACKMVLIYTVGLFALPIFML